MGEGSTREGIIARKGFISIDGEEYVPRRQVDELREERDRLAAEVQRLQDELARHEN
jgi:polyhydroxyalkanoate synthesis regulator phasin